MAKTVKKIQINLTAGTRDFLIEMDRSNAKLREFGRTAKEAGGHGVTSVQAISGGLRVLEGGLNNNLRAAERFIASFRVLGDLAQKAFPLIGGIAFLGLVAKMSEEVTKFYTTMRDAPEKIRGSFAELTSGLKKTNDELDLTNARLENDIAKLEGKRQNTLKIALDEARVAADNLTQSLDKSLDSLNKVLEENKSGIWSQIFGRISDKGLREELGGKTGLGGFRSEIRDINTSGRSDIEAAVNRKDQAGVDAAIKALKDKLGGKYSEMLAALDKQIQAAKDDAVFSAKRSQVANDRARNNAPGFIEELTFARAAVAEEASSVPKQIDNYSLNKRKSELDASRSNAKPERPYADEIKKLGVELDAIKAKTLAAGWTETGKVVAEGYGEALKIIEHLNERLEKINPNLKLNAAEMGQISLASQKISAAKAEDQWQTKLAQTTASIKDQVKTQELLTAAIGKGYEELKRANVETQVMAKIGVEKYNDPKFMAAHAAEVSGIRAGEAAAEEAKHNTEMAKAVDTIKDQITLETRLAQVQSDGAYAVRLATLQVTLARMAEAGASKELLRLTEEEFRAAERLHSSERITTIDEEIAAIHRLNAAQARGSEEASKAALNEKRIQAESNNATPQELKKIQDLGDAQHENQIGKAVANRVNVFADQLRQLQEEKDYLLQNLALYDDAADVARALRDIEDARLKIMVQQQLAQRDAMSGVRAFLIEMQQQAESAAAIVYKALNSAFEGLSENLTKLMTGQKTEWSKMFKDIGRDMLKSTIKSGLQQELGNLGKSIPGVGKVLDKLGVGGKPDGSTEPKALWVRFSGAGMPGNAGQSASGTPGILSGNGGLLGTGQIPKYAGAIGGFLKTLFGSFGGGGASAVSSSISFPAMASGGDISAGQTYMTGERGPELFRSGVSGHMLNATQTRSLMSGGDTHVYTIDARGTDPVLTGQRVEAAIRASHSSAIGTSIRASHDLSRRVPAGAH